MGKILFLIFIAGAIHIRASSQYVIHINAGSRAPYGTYQNLLIELNGRCSYQVREVNGRIKDSMAFSISKSQFDSIFVKAEQSGLLQIDYIPTFFGDGTQNNYRLGLGLEVNFGK